MSLSRMKFKKKSTDDLLDDLIHIAYQDIVDGDLNRIKQEIKSRMFEKDKKILELNRRINDSLWRLHQ